MAHLYYSDDVDDAVAELEGMEITLRDGEARHAATVSRVRAGERVMVGDGRGTLAECVVVSVAPTTVTLRVENSSVQAEPVPRILLAQALAKGDRDERAVQAATELGVDGIVPWQAARSVVRWDGRKRTTGPERWRTIVREAGKQSLRPRLPGVTELHSTRELASFARGRTMLVLEPTSTEPLSDFTVDAGTGTTDIVLVVGPEGGISPPELADLTGAGGRAVRLGENVLRTSTAGPAAISLVSMLLGRW